MTEHTLGISIGIFTGCIIGIILTIIALKQTKTDGDIKCKYDERQQMVRGKGFKYAFFTLLFYNFFTAGLSIAFEKLPVDGSGFLMIGAILGMLVYVIYAIWNEAYFSLNENPQKIVIVFLLIGLLNIILGIFQIVQGRFLENGMLTFRSANLIVGIATIIILGVIAAKRLCQKREED